MTPLVSSAQSGPRVTDTELLAISYARTQPDQLKKISIQKGKRTEESPWARSTEKFFVCFFLFFCFCFFLFFSFCSSFLFLKKRRQENSKKKKKFTGFLVLFVKTRRLEVGGIGLRSWVVSLWPSGLSQCRIDRKGSCCILKKRKREDTQQFSTRFLFLFVKNVTSKSRGSSPEGGDIMAQRSVSVSS